jgi:tRNA/rRNA methyltransferase
LSLDNVRIVLMNPIYGGNVGSVCRAMANMGLSDLAVALPRPMNMDEARMMACHATAILDGRSECGTLAEAVSDCRMVVGTTARAGLYREHATTPRDVAPAVLAAAAGGKVALVFGREDNGLSNDEIALCTHIVQIPSSPARPSLNVAQAVMICAYELFVAAGVHEPLAERSPEAPSGLRERMFSIWRDTLLRIGFMKEDKADHMMLGLRRVLSRGVLTVNDARIIMGIAKQTRWAAEHGARAGRGLPTSDEEDKSVDDSGDDSG